MGIWFVALLAAEVVAFVAYVYLWRRYPALNIPFDYQYRVFRRAHRAYQPVKEGKKLYKIFADEFLLGYRHVLEKGASFEQQAAAYRICNIIENHREMVERYLGGRFNYTKYLNLKGEYDLFQEQVAEVKTTVDDEQPRRTVSLRRKIMLFESLFRVCRVDASNADKARFIRDLLEVEPNTKDIANTNTYKILKTSNKELITKGEINARIKDYGYVADQLKRLGLDKEHTLILNEIKELGSSIVE